MEPMTKAASARGPSASTEDSPAEAPTPRPATTPHDTASGAATPTPRTVRAPRGATLRCRGWTQEAALRMLMNNLDPEVAEKPGDLVVYGGTGRAARSWTAFDAIVATLETLADDETLLVQSGKPVGVFRTHAHAPRVLIANSNLVGRWATWEHFHELERRGLMMYGQMTAGSWIYIGTQGILQGTYETFGAMARTHFGGSLAGRWILTGGMGGMGGAQPLAATMNGAAILVVEVDEERIRRRIETRYCDRMTRDLDEAVAWVLGAAGAGEAVSVGLVGNCAEVLPELMERGVIPDIVTDQTSAHDPVDGYVPYGFSIDEAIVLRNRDRNEYRLHSMKSIRRHCEAIVEMMRRGSVAVDYGNNLRGYAKEAGFEDAFAYPGFVPAYVRPLFCEGKGPFRWVALSGDPADIHRTDDLVLEMFPEDEHLCRWIRMARDQGRLPGAACTHLLAGAGGAGALRRGHERPGRQRRDQRAHRDRARPPGHGVRRVAVPGDRGDEGRDRRGGRLARPERAAEHGFGRELGVVPPWGRGGDRGLAARGAGAGGRWQRGDAHTYRAGADERSGAGRGPACGCGVRGGAGDGAGQGGQDSDGVG